MHYRSAVQHTYGVKPVLADCDLQINKGMKRESKNPSVLLEKGLNDYRLVAR